MPSPVIPYLMEELGPQKQGDLGCLECTYLIKSGSHPRKVLVMSCSQLWLTVIPPWENRLSPLLSLSMELIHSHPPSPLPKRV